MRDCHSRVADPISQHALRAILAAAADPIVARPTACVGPVRATITAEYPIRTRPVRKSIRTPNASGTTLLFFVRKLQPDLPVMLALFRPVLAHLHEQEQMHAAAEDFFHLGAR